jgi:hypothetical protein
MGKFKIGDNVLVLSGRGAACHTIGTVGKIIKILDDGILLVHFDGINEEWYYRLNEIKKINKKNDSVNHPSHYTFYKKEVIDIIKDCLTPEEFKGYLKGNLIKYRMRAGLKNDRDEDLKKSNWYQDRLKEIEK